MRKQVLITAGKSSIVKGAVLFSRINYIGQMNCRETMPPINTEAKKRKGMHGHYEPACLFCSIKFGAIK